ncbi:hypothetical protein [Rhizobium phaseoli]|uniref:Cbb3-type cytochrome c oxidase subunit 3 n=1 Tax=Rhizobium phaseoli TaxID=396 RepID=A0ABM6C8U7_9HYPH|nr:hypothetical protein [Rhizobium phaseoli]ANL84636.1 hypothetical protein AMC81_CH01855 [Rhizobium phaseoli]ANL91143.1 hypothetical protein AMC80_CH01855 [Rhizobium phaseoli]
MTFLQGLLFCGGAAVLYAAFVFVIRRMERDPLLDDLDFDNGTPGWVEEDNR